MAVADASAGSGARTSSTLPAGRQAVQVLIVGQHGVRLRAPEVRVPDREQPEQGRGVVAQLGGAEVLVHGVGAPEQRLEAVEADGHRDRQTDARPQAVSPTDPIPESKH